MGILNVTPDSFSDGGRFNRVDSALKHALQMEAEGARIVDIGGESTRPGAIPVPLEEELERVIPVIEKIRANSDVAISIDTSKPELMRAAIEAGATSVIQPGGSMRDDEVIAAADKAGIAMIFTGTRHFRH